MFERFRSRSRNGSDARARIDAMPGPAIRALEPRFVFDGAAAQAAAQAHSDAAAQSHGDPAEHAADTAHADTHTAAPAAAAPGTETASANGRHEIVVIDKGVADLQTLLAGVPASAEVILIDSGRDGFDQLADALEGRSGIDAIHILSHGSAGDLHLGTGELTAETIQGRYAADLAVIGRALSASGDLLIYGCDFAAGATGARAAALLAEATGADVAASDDATGATALGGDWDLEVHDGSIETGVVIGEAAQRDWQHLLSTAADNGRGALLAVSARSIYSVDILTGKATLLTTAPASVDGIALGATLNSLAVDQANGLIYYVDGASDANNKALFAYDFINDRHILIKADLTQGGPGTTIVTGTPGLGAAGAAFSGGALYLAVENVSNTTDQIYKLTFSNGGRTVAAAATFGDQSNHNYDWGDIGIDQANGELYSITRASYARFSLSTGLELSYDASVTRTDVQTGVDQGGFVYTLGANVTRIDPVNGAVIGTAKAITTDGTTSVGTVSDAASWTPPTSTISGKVFGDSNASGTYAAPEPGVAGVTVQLVDDVNGNGTADTGERVLATDTTDANGNYAFTGLLPGTFVVQVTDTAGKLTGTTATTATTGSVTETKVGATLAGPDFGYRAPPVIDLDTASNGSGYATTYTERAPGVAITGAATSVADIDNTDLSSAKAVIGNGDVGDTLAISGTLPGAITAAYDPATRTLTLTGTATRAQYQSALEQIRFSSDNHNPSTATRSIAVTVNDGTSDSNVATTTVAFTAVNDAPVNGLPAAQTVNEDTDLVFSTANTNRITISDIDAGSGVLTTTLGVLHGTLSVAGTTGVTVTGRNTGTLTLTGTVAAINAALNGATYRGAQDFNGADTLTITTDDGGNTGAGGAQSDQDTLGITVRAVADAPTNSVPATTQAATEDTALVFSTANGNAVRVTDPDGGTLTVTLATGQGRLSLSRVTGLIFATGDGANDASMTFSGTIADINAALDGLRFDPNADFNGSAQISLSTQDPTRTADNFSNGGFEQPAQPANSFAYVDDGAVPGWSTTASDHKIEIWGTGFRGITAYEGNQFAEINATQVAALYQDFTTAAGSTISLDFAHRGRSGTDVMQVSVIDLGADGLAGTGDDTTVFQKSYADGNAAWGAYHEQLAQTSSGNMLRFEFRSVSAAGGDPGVGNFVDGIAIQQAFHAASTIDIAVAPVADIVPDAVTGDEDTPITFNALTGASGGSPDTFESPGAAISSVTQGAHGSVGFLPDGTLTYSPAANFNGTDSFTYTVTSGGTTETTTVTVTVRPVNDAPVNGLPATQSVDEDTDLVFSTGNGNTITVSDVDAGGGSLTTTLSVQHGTLTLGGTARVTVAGSGTGTVTLTGTVADINAALNGTTYRGALNYNGADTLTIATDDGGNTGAGGAMSDSDTLGLTVRPVADAPTNTAPTSPQATTEDTALVFSAANGNAVRVGDPDGGSLTVTLSTNHGLLSLSRTDRLSFAVGDGADDGTVTFSGTIADINAALEGLRFAPTADYNGSAQIILATRDPQGATTSSTIDLTIAPVADIVPDTVATNEDTPISFNPLTGMDGGSRDGFDSGAAFVSAVGPAAHGSVSFLPDGSMTYTPEADFNGSDSFTYTVTSGGVTETATVTVTVRPANDAPVLDLGPRSGGSYVENGPGIAIVGAGVSITDIDSPTLASATIVIGNGRDGDVLTVAGTLPTGIVVGPFDPLTHTLTLSGAATPADYEAALQQIRFSSTSDAPTTDTRSIAISVNDGTSDSAVATATVTVADVNDAPVNGVPASLAVNEDGSLVFSGSNAITVSDPDAGTADLTTTLGVGHGTLTLGPAGGVIVTGDRTGAVTLTGSAAAINAALAGTTYRPDADFNGADALTIVTTDNGNSGSGGARDDTDTVAITVAPVNDAPVNGVPGAQGVDEDAALVFSAGNSNAITVSDIDAGSGHLTTTLSVLHGTLTLGSATNGVTVTGSGTGTLTLSGTVANINAALDGTTYRGDRDVNGADMLTVTTDDQGNTGGGALRDSDTIAITVRPVADAPTNAVPASLQAATEDTGLVFSAAAGNGISVADADGGRLTVTLSSAQGRISLSRTTGLSFASGDGADDAGMTFSGTIADINAALDGLRFAPAADYYGPARIALVTRDPQGATATSTIDLAIDPVADIVPDSVATDEDTAITFNPLTGAGGAARDGFEDPAAFVSAVGTAAHGSVSLGFDGTLTYTPGADFNGTDRFSYTVTSGGVTETATITVTVRPVNDAPVLDLDGPAAGTGYATTYTENGAGVPIVGADLSVTDVDSAGMASARAAVTNGRAGDTLSIAGTLPPGIRASFDPATYILTLSGSATKAAYETALRQVRFASTSDDPGSDSRNIAVSVDDGGRLSNVATTTVAVTAVNDAPVHGLPLGQSLAEDGRLVFSGMNGNGLTVSDPDAGTGTLTTTIGVGHGTLTLGSTTGVTVVGDRTGSVMLTGTVAAINAALDGTTYRPAADYAGPDTLTIITTDNGNSGSGGAKSDSDALAITVTPVNDAPVNGVPVAQSVAEDTGLVFSAAGGNAVTVSDVDAGSGRLTTTLGVGHGTLTLGSTAGVTVANNGSGSVTLTGTAAAINAALEGTTYRAAANFNGADTLTIVTGDNGNTGAGGAKSDSDALAITVTPVNDAPVNGVPGTQGVAEDADLVFSAANGNAVTVSDVDAGSGDLSTTLTVLHGTLTLGSTTGVTVTGDRSGSVTLTGTEAAINAALEGTIYRPAADYNGADTLTVVTSDNGNSGFGGALSDSDMVALNVVPVNDAPVLDLNGPAAGTDYATAYTENGSGVAIVGAGVSVTDIDSATIASASVFIQNGRPGDTLSIAGTLPPGLSVRIDDAAHTLTLTGLASKADYQAALLQIRFASTSENPATDTRSIAISVNDGALRSNVTRTTIDVTAVNDAPVNGMPAGQGLAEDGSLVFSSANGNGITVSDTDAGTGRLTTTIGVGHGTLTLGSTTGVTVVGNRTGSVTLTGTVDAINAALDGTTYRPAADYNGTDTLGVVTTDNGNTGSGGAKTDSDAIALTIASVDDAPGAGVLPAQGSLDGDTVTGTDLGRYFSDVDGDTLRFSAGGLPAGLAIDPTTGIVRGTIDRSASQGGSRGDYTVTVTADDGRGGLTSRSFTWRVLDPAPTARNDAAITDAATPATGSVLADNGNGADSDPDGDPLTVTAVNGAVAAVGQSVAGSAGGRFTVLADGSYRFEPGSDFTDLAAGQSRTTRIAYTISDGEGGVAQATLVVTVTGLNDAPVALAPGDRAARDGDAVALPLGSLFSDPDGEGLRYSATGLPPGLSIDPATGAVTGTIDHAASGAAGLTDYRVTITATDPEGASTTRGFTFRVTNPAPQAANDAATTREDTPVTVDVLANDTDGDGDTLTIVATGDAAPSAGHGQVAVVNGQLRYTPAANFNGTDTITYTVSDGNGGTSTATVTVTVTPVNDTPTAGTLPDQSGHDGASVSYDIADRFADADTPSGDSLRFTATGLPPGLTIDPATGLITGNLPNDPAPVERYAVTVTATDASGASVTRGFTWTVTNGAPTAAPDTATTRENTPVLVTVTANDSDPEGDAIRLVDEPGATSAAHGTVSVDPATGLLTYTPVAGFSGRDTIVYTIEDANGARATGTVTITVTPVNEAPTAPETLPGRNGADGDAVRVPLGGLFADPDGDPLAYAATGLPPGLSIDPATGAITGTIDHAASGPDGRTTYVVTLTATDPGGLTVTRSFGWTVTNPAPAAVDDAVVTREDTPLDIDVTANDTDRDGDTLSVVPGSVSAAHGTVTLNPDGSLHYTPDRDFNGTDHIVYTITDGNGGFATASATITVTPVNDAPTVDATSPALADRTALDAQELSIPVAGAFGDVDAGDRLSFSAAGLPPGLSIDPATGLISGTLASDASTRVPGGVYTVTLTGTDRAGASATTQLTITVGNPAPIAADDTATVAEDGVLTGSVLGNDRDPDGDALRVDPVPVTGPAHGQLVLRPDGSFTYTPDADFNGADSFTYAVIDSDGARATATVTLTVIPVNDAPVATAPPVQTREDVSVDGRVTASDPDGDPLTYTVETPPGAGTVTIRPDGSFTYTPAPDTNGPDSFVVRVTDDRGGSVLVTVPVSVEPVNDAPIATAPPIQTREDTPVDGRVTASDPDGDPLTYTVETPPNAGTVAIRPDGSFTYTPGPDTHGPDSFVVRVTDDRGGSVLVTVPLTVDPVNDAPDGHADPITLPANTVGAGQVVATDRDGDPLSFQLVDGPANGTVTLAPDGSYAYTPYAAYSGADRFTVAVSDGRGGSTLVAVAITVTPNPVQVPPSAFVPILSPLPVAERPAAPPVLPLDTAITAPGIVLPAVAEIDALGSVGDVILADGAVVAAVNGVASLHGTTILVDHPVMLDESARIARLAWERFERAPIGDTPWFSPRPYLGRSLAVSFASEAFAPGTGDLMVEAIRRPDTLAISLRNTAPGLDAVTAVRLLGLDGTPRPDWIESDGQGGFWGRPPAGTGLIRLELEIELENGRVVRRPLTVDAETGEVRALPGARPAPDSGADGARAPEPAPRPEAPLFSTQLAALGSRDAHDLALIEKALSRGI